LDTDSFSQVHHQSSVCAHFGNPLLTPLTEVTPMLAAVYYPKSGLPNRWQDLIKAGANIGT
jgi:hypothetical protein